MKKILIIVGAVVLLAGVGVGGMMFGKSSAKPEDPASLEEEIAADAEGHGEEAGGHGAKETDGHGGGHGKETAAAGKSSAADLIYKFDPITTNLSDDLSTIVQFVIEVETASPDGRKAVEENLAPLKDATIMLVSSKTKADIGDKERLKRELMTRFQGVLNSSKIVRNIYLTDFKVVPL